MLSLYANRYHGSVKQILTRVDDELAEALKRQAAAAGESMNSYVNRLLRIAVAGPGSDRQMWKVAAIADGRLVARGVRRGRRRDAAFTHAVTTPAGYAAELVRAERGEP